MTPIEMVFMVLFTRGDIRATAVMPQPYPREQCETYLAKRRADMGGFYAAGECIPVPKLPEPAGMPGTNKPYIIQPDGAYVPRGYICNADGTNCMPVHK